jgi:hypothetical protein
VAAERDANHRSITRFSDAFVIEICDDSRQGLCYNGVPPHAKESEGRLGHARGDVGLSAVTGSRRTDSKATVSWRERLQAPGSSSRSFP